MVLRNFFEKLAVWAGVWQAFNVGVYIFGFVAAALFGAGGNKSFESSLYLSALSATIVLIVVWKFWRRYHWSVVPAFITFDAIFAAAGLWANHVRYSQFVASSTAKGGVIASKNPDFWMSLTEPLVAKSVGYVIAAIGVALLSRRGAQSASMDGLPADHAASETTRISASLISVFCALACAGALSGILSAVWFVFTNGQMPLKQAEFSALHYWGLAMLFTIVWYGIGGRVFSAWGRPAELGTAITASFLVQSASILKSVIPKLFFVPSGMDLPVSVMIQALGLTIFTALVTGIFFWFGARAKKAT